LCPQVRFAPGALKTGLVPLQHVLVATVSVFAPTKSKLAAENIEI
jgi:hypothetical protein